MEPQNQNPDNQSNDVVDPAEEKRTDLPSSPDEQGQVQQPDHNDQVSETPAGQVSDAAPVYNDPSRPAPQQPASEEVSDDQPQVGAGEDPDSPSDVSSDTQDSSPQSSSEADSS